MATGKTPPKKKKPKEEKVEAKKEAPATKESGRGIVRIAGKDLRGHLKLNQALIHIKGIGHTMSVAAARTIESKLGIPPTTKVGELTDEQIENIDEILTNLHKHDIPSYLFNRRKDYLTNDNIHVIMNDLLFATNQDIDREKKAYTWRGYRHAYGQKVRGQRTRNTGRKGMAVGVLRKAILAQQQKAKEEEGKKGAEKK
ncbi:MAG: 30S ribosomal protein S13 [Candidatus Bilamarchaeaceae archaeon]